MNAGLDRFFQDLGSSMYDPSGNNREIVFLAIDSMKARFYFLMRELHESLLLLGTETIMNFSDNSLSSFL